MKKFEAIFEKKIDQILGHFDPAHDLAHVKRVVANAKILCEQEQGQIEVVLPAAWLHDIVNLPKNHPERKLASKMAANVALEFLVNIDYPQNFLPQIAHAIEAHSFSGGIFPKTIEAKIIQDADRLDALGAIGLARLFSVSSQLNRPFYHLEDPFAVARQLDDQQNAIDHIEIKLKKIVNTMNTQSARQEAHRRFSFIENFIEELKNEVSPNSAFF